MIVDLRTYTCKPFKTAQFVAIYEKLAWPLQKKYLGRCLGWYTSIEGPQHRVIHLWAYEDQADRESRRKAMIADPAFAEYIRVVEDADVLSSMENTIVSPTNFSTR